MERLLLGVGLLLCLGISLAHWHTINPDALSYLEVGEAWWRGDFAAAINGYWSPLFPILIGLAAKLAPARFTELVPIHLLQVVILAGAFYAFRWFLRAVERQAGGAIVENRFYFRLAAHAIFFWACFTLFELGEILPDLLLTIWVLLAGGCILRLADQGWTAAARLGFVLALAYLTKPVMFPLGVASLFLCFLAAASWRGAFAMFVVSGAVFLSISALYIVPLSVQKGRLTFSDSGGLAYAWEVNRITPYFHWQGVPPETGTPRHGTRQILDFPPAYEFDRNQPGTYPPWYDASYWNDGIRPRFDWRDQVRRLARSAAFYRQILLHEPGAAALLFSFLLAGSLIGWRAIVRGSRPFWPLVLMSLAAGSLYALVFLATRYLVPFAIFLGITGLATFFRSTTAVHRPEQIGCLVLAGFLGGCVLLNALGSIARGIRAEKPASYKVHARVAAELARLEVKQGDKVAVIGRGCDPYFARLLGARVIAEAPVLEGHPVWPGTTENLDRIVQAFRERTHAIAVVSDVAPVGGTAAAAWRQVEGGPYWIQRIERSLNTKD